MRADWITPDWPALPRVRAVATTRSGGVSAGVYASLNLGRHVGDAPDHVAENRRRLSAALDLHREPRWLRQVHGSRIADLNGDGITGPADGAVTRSPGEVCAIMTADCMPVLFCDRAGTTVAAAHAGWRGLVAGVLEATATAMQVPPQEILAWLGPAIGADVYEVGDEVRTALVREHADAEQAFAPAHPGKWLCDLYQLASQRLRRAGIGRIYGGGFCTYTDKDRFFSYRRDGECGRMATLIWLAG